jgi:hypothetical protein
VKILRQGCMIEGCSHSECMFRAAPRGVIVAPYVDDFCVCAQTKGEGDPNQRRNRGSSDETYGLDQSVGQGVTGTSQRFNFLGLTVDTTAGLVLIPEEKVDKYARAIEDVLSRSSVRVRDLASVAGKVVSDEGLSPGPDLSEVDLCADQRADGWDDGLVRVCANFRTDARRLCMAGETPEDEQGPFCVATGLSGFGGDGRLHRTGLGGDGKNRQEGGTCTGQLDRGREEARHVRPGNAGSLESLPTLGR